MTILAKIGEIRGQVQYWNAPNATFCTIFVQKFDEFEKKDKKCNNNRSRGK